jgi:N-acetyl-anhydromuramoyl-L-alanine amidase
LSGLKIDAAGWCSAAAHVRSPNYASRAAGETLSLVVIHAISLPPREFGGQAVEQLFTNGLPTEAHPYFAAMGGLRVSAHFFIRRTGELMQFVSCENVAWHAGVSRWRERDGCNAFSLGIELEGCDELAFEEPQYSTLNALLDALQTRYPTLTDTVAHSEISPGRKTDPGPCFEWSKLTNPMWRHARVG